MCFFYVYTRVYIVIQYQRRQYEKKSTQRQRIRVSKCKNQTAMFGRRKRIVNVVYGTCSQYYYTWQIRENPMYSGIGPRCDGGGGNETCEKNARSERIDFARIRSRRPILVSMRIIRVLCTLRLIYRYARVMVIFVVYNVFNNFQQILMIYVLRFEYVFYYHTYLDVQY